MSSVLCYVPNMHIYNIAQGFVVVVVVLIGRRWSIGTGLLLLFLILLFLQVNRYWFYDSWNRTTAALLMLPQRKLLLLGGHAGRQAIVLLLLYLHLLLSNGNSGGIYLSIVNVRKVVQNAFREWIKPPSSGAYLPQGAYQRVTWWGMDINWGAEMIRHRFNHYSWIFWFKVKFCLLNYSCTASHLSTPFLYRSLAWGASSSPEITGKL